MIRKLIKLGLMLFGVGAIAFLAIGFGKNPEFDQRYEFTVDAPRAKIAAVLEDATNTPKWLPEDFGKIESVQVETSFPMALGLHKGVEVGNEILEKVGTEIRLDSDKDSDAAHHVYLMDKGGKLHMRWLKESKPGTVYLERVVKNEGGMPDFDEETIWGFELADVEGEKGKTRISVIMRGKARKPHGTFFHTVMSWTGMDEKGCRKMAENLAAVANGKR